MIEVVGVLVTAADSEHPCTEHVGKAVDDARRIAPIREHPSEPVGQAEAPISHRQQHYAAVRCEPPTIECSCDFLGVNGWKRERQDRIVGHGGRGACVDVAGLASQPNPTPHQCITPRSPAIQTPSGE
jgi:hypothetical protein